jgi:hypothetical protein
VRDAEPSKHPHNAEVESPFPAGLPEDLAAMAFVSGEPAWEQLDCDKVIRWLSENGYAVLGTELWLVRNSLIHTLMNTKSGRILCCTSCDPLPHESWNEYVKRSAGLAAESVSGFRWPEDSTENADTFCILQSNLGRSTVVRNKRSIRRGLGFRNQDTETAESGFCLEKISPS